MTSTLKLLTILTVIGCCSGMITATASAGHGRINIRHAEYGAQGRYMDVTRLLQAHVSGDGIHLQVTNRTMGGDPAPGVPKHLKVRYTFGGREHRDTVREDGWFTASGRDTRPESPGHVSPPRAADGHRRLVILKAEYGAGGRYWDVTDRVRRHASDGSIRLRVSNEAMGGDPVPNTPKKLRVTYLQNGKEMRTRVAEGDWFTAGRGGSPGQGGGYPPADPNSRDRTLVILNATYGAPGRSWNVTQRVAHAASDGSVNLHVTNQAMGGDPAPGTPKRLRVSYRKWGKTHEEVVREGDWFVVKGDRHRNSK